jgi:hypothetical protein
MKMNIHVTHKKLLIAGVAVATVASAGLFLNTAIAQGGGALDGLAGTIATTYHLNKDQVKTTIQQFRQQKLAEREASFQQDLDKAVTDGKLTQDQKNKILTERADIRTKLDNIKAMPKDSARQTAFKKLMDDVKQWAKDNKIALRWLRASGHAAI